MQTQGRNFFSVRAFGADDRISNSEKIFSGESISQSAQSSKFGIHRACVFASSNISLDLHNKSNVRLGAVQQVYNIVK